MKKSALTLLLITFMTFQADLIAQDKSKLKMGLKVSPNLGWMSPNTKGYKSDGARLGATVGFIGDFHFAENYALSTGFNFQFLHGKLGFNDSILMENSSTMHTVDLTRKYNFIYVEIPLMIKMKTKSFGKIAYYGQIGLGTGFRIKASSTDHYLKPNGQEVDNQEDYNYGTSLIRESVLVGIGCEISVDESSRIILGLGYSNSLNNLLTGTNNKSGLKEKSLFNFTELQIGFIF